MLSGCFTTHNLKKKFHAAVSRSTCEIDCVLQTIRKHGCFRKAHVNKLRSRLFLLLLLFYKAHVNKLRLWLCFFFFFYKAHVKRLRFHKVRVKTIVSQTAPEKQSTVNTTVHTKRHLNTTSLPSACKHCCFLQTTGIYGYFVRACDNGYYAKHR